MGTNADGLRARTKEFAFSVIRLAGTLPRTPTTDALSRQLVRAATGVACNYRAAGRARSRREFIARLGVVLEEADEAEFWLDAFTLCDLTSSSAAQNLRHEARELRAIFSAAVRTARQATPRVDGR